MNSSDLKQYLKSIGGESKAKGNTPRRPVTKGDTSDQQGFLTELNEAIPHDPLQPKMNQCYTYRVLRNDWLTKKIEMYKTRTIQAMGNIFGLYYRTIFAPLNKPSN